MTGNAAQYYMVIKLLKDMANPENAAGMARYGINLYKTLGISVKELRVIAREIGRNHELSLKLWQSGIHEARLLAALIGILALVRPEQMENWVLDFDSWDVCDQCCASLFVLTPYAFEAAMDWSGRDEEFVKRAGFVMMAKLAVSDKKAEDQAFEPFLEAILSGSLDKRNFVRKAVNWALRQIGKRNFVLNQKAIALACQISQLRSPSAGWIAADALRELNSTSVQSRLKKRPREIV